METKGFFFLGISIGWAAGFGGCWLYFIAMRLIRTRREWYADRLMRGLPVPKDWDREGG